MCVFVRVCVCKYSYVSMTHVYVWAEHWDGEIRPHVCTTSYYFEGVHMYNRVIGARKLSTDSLCVGRTAQRERERERGIG